MNAVHNYYTTVPQPFHFSYYYPSEYEQMKRNFKVHWDVIILWEYHMPTVWKGLVTFHYSFIMPETNNSIIYTVTQCPLLSVKDAGM